MPKTIRSLERGLRVLAAMQTCPISSLHEIYVATRIPKPSLLRILSTLEQVGAVSRRLADGHYRISALNRATRKRDRYDRVAEAAAPVLDRLCRKISWPSDLLVPAGDHLELRESSRVRTPFSTYFMHDRVGTPVNWVLSPSVAPIFYTVPPRNATESWPCYAGGDMASATRALSVAPMGSRPLTAWQASLCRFATTEKCMASSISSGQKRLGALTKWYNVTLGTCETPRTKSSTHSAASWSAPTSRLRHRQGATK